MGTVAYFWIPDNSDYVVISGMTARGGSKVFPQIKVFLCVLRVLCVSDQRLHNQ